MVNDIKGLPPAPCRTVRRVTPGGGTLNPGGAAAD
jgi:hypothetical protein